MGIIRINDVDNYFWLGRYGQRVLLTTLEFFRMYDYIIEHEDAYITFCNEMEIPNIYSSPEDFVSRYLFDETNENSVISNLNRAYDNAIIFRNVIKSDSLAYIHLALIEMQKGRESASPIIELQHVLDYLRAFWTCIEDKIETDEEREFIFIGRYYEQLDLYLRRNYDYNDVHRSYRKLAHRLERNQLAYNKGLFEAVGREIEERRDYGMDMVLRFERIFELPA
ncbi:MAG: alpha-E domain-containing protein [Wujia sp.]